jgi:molecular chaperone DnaK (HSP70)
MKPYSKRLWFQRLKPECDDALSNVAFNFKLCWYSEVFSAGEVSSMILTKMKATAEAYLVEQCRLTPSNPR